METDGNSPVEREVKRVCTNCKLRKRRCDKALPKCTLCARKRLRCYYSSPESKEETSDNTKTTLVHYESRTQEVTAPPLTLPAIQFLDPSLLLHGQSPGSSLTHVVLPKEILVFLGDIDTVEDGVSCFFKKVDPWMPFISRRRFSSLYQQRNLTQSPDLACLLLSMDLVSQRPNPISQDCRTPLYHAVKLLFEELASCGCLSLSALQAGILVALYELGHAIYPAAYMTIGACARYAHALGINPESSSVATDLTFSLLEAEERRRTWWAIVILDRFVNIGSPGRPFSAADPDLQDFLPADREDWDRGVIETQHLHTVSTPVTSSMQGFPLLCQSARLLGQVLRHVHAREASSHDAVQLDRTIYSILEASLNVDRPDEDQIAFIYSTLLALHTPPPQSRTGSDDKSRIREEQIRRREIAIHEVSETIKSNLVIRKCFQGRDPMELAPWGLFFAYQICRAHPRYCGELGWLSEEAVVDYIKKGFVEINTKWRAAGAYLQLLEAHEVINMRA